MKQFLVMSCTTLIPVFKKNKTETPVCLHVFILKRKRKI